jgi:hypothetical protein
MCLHDKKLVDAHVVPRAFFEHMKSGDEFLEIRSSEKNFYPKKSYIGIYDNTILCEECERGFSSYDDYGQKFLIPDFQDKFLIKGSGGETAYLFPDVNYLKLKLFFLSVLWRASVSSRPEFSKIRLGPLADKLKKMILDRRVGEVDDFSIFASRFVDYFGKTGWMNPYILRITDGIKYCVFYLGVGYKIYIKIDKRPSPRNFLPLLLAENKFYVMIKKNFLKSKDFAIISSMFKK